MTSLADKAIFSGAGNRPPMLEKDMYDSWKSRIEMYMLNRLHGRMILESIENTSCKTTKELWESLKKRHVGEERVRQAWLQSLMIGFQTLQMKEDNTMDAFTAKLNGYATKAKVLGKTLDKSLLVRKLLDSTPDRFIQIVASIEQTNDLDDITLDEIVRKLKAFEERIKHRKEGQVESQENLLFAHGEHSRKGTRFSKCGDDLIITGTPRKEIDLFKSQMEDKFEMSDLGLLAYYLGIEVTQTGGEITIRQTGYINKILKETSRMESNDTKIPMDPGTKLVKAKDGNLVDATYYRSLIESLRYLLHTRPDLSYLVGLLSRFMKDPKDHHLKAIKHVIRYIQGTKEHGTIYKKEGSCKFTGYIDSSYEINTDQRKGTTGIVFYWCTQKQPMIALSSCKSEFMAATGAACQVL
nr:ribonuclease H-like domain, reverse transcriptase, RNA-dependent DNA polymerase [Tanacetum cinerariifolium]